MGRSRGGLTTKIHAVVDADGRPVRLTLTAGQAHDGRPAEELLGDLREGAILLADQAYDSNAIRHLAKARGAWPNIPPKRNRKGSFVFSAWFCPEKPGRMLLQQAQAVRSNRYPIRQGSPKLSRRRQIRFSTDLHQEL